MASVILRPEQIKPDGGFRNTVLIEFIPFWKALKSGWFWGSLLLSALVLVFTYQLPFTRNLQLGSSTDRPFMFGYYPPENFQNLYYYSWTRPSSLVVLPRVGQPASLRIDLELATRPEGVPPARIRLLVNNAPVAEFTSPTVSELRKKYSFNYTAENRKNSLDFKSDQIEIRMEMDEHRAPGDPRSLGVAVVSLAVTGSGLLDSGRPTFPDPGFLVLTLGALALCFVLALRLGWSSRYAAAGVALVALLLAIGLALDRPIIGVGAPLLLETALLTYPLTVLVIRVTGWWLEKAGLDSNPSALRWLGLIFLLAFAVRLLGINHPSFQTIDHGFRIHETADISRNVSLIFSRYYDMTSGTAVGGVDGRSQVAGQWGLQVALPYSPLFYIFDLPVAYLTGTNDPALLYWTNVFAMWLDASALVLLYLLARFTLGRFGNTAGLMAALLSGFFPLSFLMASDGGYNTILANWFMMLWLALAGSWIKKLPSWRSAGLAGLGLGLALLAHTAALLMLGALVFFYILILYAGRKRALAGRVALSYGVGLLFSFGLYYGFYVVALVTRTLPALAGKIGQGDSVGRDNRVLTDFWPSLLAHFHLLPFILTLFLCGVLLLNRWRRTVFLPGLDEISAPAQFLYLTWFGTFLLFALVALRINLLQKHMLFALPLFALFTGLALALLIEHWRVRPLPARLALAGVCLWYVAAGCYTWYMRAIEYLLPLGTG